MERAAVVVKKDGEEKRIADGRRPGGVVCCLSTAEVEGGRKVEGREVEEGARKWAFLCNFLVPGGAQVAPSPLNIDIVLPVS